jgi:phosphatidylinositol glycan class B
MLETFLARSGFKKDLRWSRFAFQWLTLAFILHVIAAVQSIGFYHADEHFQIVEFMNFKLGGSPANELPLEYGQLMRPWLLPAILGGITSFLNAIGIRNPFDWALSYRLLAGIVGWLSTVGLCLSSYVWFPEKKWRNWAVIAMTLLWYMPSLHARHSSENLSASLFFIGLSFSVLMASPKQKHTDRPESIPLLLSFLIGLLFGFAFEFRFQMGAMILGAVLWFLVMARVSLREISAMLLGILAVVGLGCLADRWGYGQWTFTPWNYLKYNIIDHHVSDSDSTPWWDYFRRAVTESWPVLGFITLLSFPIAWLRNPKHILTWSLLPFFLTHEIIGHKELRFLFPLAHAGGILLVMSIAGIHWPVRKWIQWPIRALMGLNIVGLICLTLVPAWIPVQFYSKLYSFHPYGFQLYYKDDTFFNFGGAIMNFYLPEDRPFIRVQSYEEFAKALQETERPLWLFYSRAQLPADADLIKDLCKIEFSTLPGWVENLNLRKKLDRVTNWTLYQCHRPTRINTGIQERPGSN